MLNASCVIWNVLVALRDTGGQTEIPAGVNTRSSCPWNTSTWSSTIGQHQILSWPIVVLGYLANSLIFTVELDEAGDIGDIPPILGIPSPSSRWVPLTRDRQMESQPTPWENPTQALLYIYQDYIVSKLQSSFQGFSGRPSHQMHLFRHDTALSLLAPGNMAIWQSGNLVAIWV